MMKFGHCVHFNDKFFVYYIQCTKMYYETMWKYASMKIKTYGIDWIYK